MLTAYAQPAPNIKRHQQTPRDINRDDLFTLQQVSEANLIAGIHFLEHLVLQKRSAVSGHYTILGVGCLDLMILVMTESRSGFAISKLLRRPALSLPYRGVNLEALARKNRIICLDKDRHHLLHFASTTPESEHKRVRLKAVLFLQGSRNPRFIFHWTLSLRF
jgi:vacuolar protein sorting-associated protein 3